MTTDTLPSLPPVAGARYVTTTEAAAGYASVGFALPSREVRCHVPSGRCGAIFVYRKNAWRIESGGLQGQALRAMNRYAKSHR